MEIGFTAFFEKFTGVQGQREKGWMGADTTEPVLGVGVIRFTPVHDAVNEAAVGIFNVLCEIVGGVQVIVPKIDQRPEKFFKCGSEADIAKGCVEATVELRNGEGARA